MKRVIRLLIVIALCYFVLPASAQGKGDGLRKQAQESLADKDYTRARYMFLQAYNAYIGAAQYEQAVACGVQASALYHRENYYNEAFELLYPRCATPSRANACRCTSSCANRPAPRTSWPS